MTMPTVSALAQMSTAELLALFCRLEAPTVQEMSGEYAARLLSQPNPVARVAGWLAVSNPWQPWLCKAFRPLDADSGRGYNTFLKGGQVVQRHAMQTLMAPSRFDGRPAYQLVYRHFHSPCALVHMVDEVRRLDAGLYLGIGTYGFTAAQRQRPHPFLLRGPIRPYRSDIGRERRDFVPGRRELPGLF